MLSSKFDKLQKPLHCCMICGKQNYIIGIMLATPQQSCIGNMLIIGRFSTACGEI